MPLMHVYRMYKRCNSYNLNLTISFYPCLSFLFTAVYNWRGDTRYGLPLEIGETVQILEECTGKTTRDRSWFHVSLTNALARINVDRFGERVDRTSNQTMDCL